METRSEITMQDLKRDVENLRSNLKDLMRSGKWGAKERLSDAKQRLWETAQNVEQRTEAQVRDAYQTVCDQSTKALDAGREQIEKRPLASVLWSFGIGLIVGRLLLLRR